VLEAPARSQTPESAWTICSSSARATYAALRDYVGYFNRARPHQGLGQVIPEALPVETRCREELTRAVPVLAGLHHMYERGA